MSELQPTGASEGSGAVKSEVQNSGKMQRQTGGFRSTKHFGPSLPQRSRQGNTLPPGISQNQVKSQLPNSQNHSGKAPNQQGVQRTFNVPSLLPKKSSGMGPEGGSQTQDLIGTQHVWKAPAGLGSALSGRISSGGPVRHPHFLAPQQSSRQNHQPAMMVAQQPDPQGTGVQPRLSVTGFGTQEMLDKVSYFDTIGTPSHQAHVENAGSPTGPQRPAAPCFREYQGSESAMPSHTTSLRGPYASGSRMPATPFPLQPSTSAQAPPTAASEQWEAAAPRQRVPLGSGTRAALPPSSSGIIVAEAGVSGFRDVADSGKGKLEEDALQGSEAGHEEKPGSQEDLRAAHDEEQALSRDIYDKHSEQLTRLPVICNGNRGDFIVERQVIVCLCTQCEAKAAEMNLPEMELSPTDFERHSGSCTSKKWKYTVKVLEKTFLGSSPGMCVGTWLEKNAPKIAKSRAKILGYSSIFGDVAPSQLKPDQRKKKKKKAVADDDWRAHGESAGFRNPGGNSSSPEFADGSVEVEVQGTPPVAGVTAAEMTSPSGKKWLTNADHADKVLPSKPEIRRGEAFQAAIPTYLGPKPAGRESDDHRAGVPGPSTLEALALAAEYEKSASDALHIDAVADPDYHPGGVYDVRNLIVERGQRSRRRPKWLTSSVDPEAVPRKQPLFIDDQSGGDDDDHGPPSWRQKASVKRKAPQEAFSDRKRMRPLNNLSSGHNDVRGGSAWQNSNSAPPRVAQWTVLHDGFMRITVSYQGQTFSGALMPQAREPRDLQSFGRQGGPSLVSRGDDSESRSEEGWGASRAPATSRPSSMWNDSAEFGGTATSNGPEVESFRGAPKPASAVQQKTNTNRRTLANRDYERLQAQGPPKDARCALCRMPADPEAHGASRVEEAGDKVDFEVLERREEGLGPFLLVRVSAIMNAWVHMQCALWSPEVYVNNVGSIERASEAVRRGRMLKCKLCGEKGATLGCHKRSCRASFHLTCARDHGCLLQGIEEEPYLVTCPEHAKISNELELVPSMPVMPDQKVRASPEQIPTRPRNVRVEMGRINYQPSLASQPSSSRSPNWDSMASGNGSLDALTVAALASKGANLDTAVNPLAAQHFGGTVGQSVLRPGRCAVCVVQRKGVCGTQTAPKKCLRRIALSAAGREIPDAPPGWRTRRPVAHWPAVPQRQDSTRTVSSEFHMKQDSPLPKEDLQ